MTDEESILKLKRSDVQCSHNWWQVTPSVLLALWTPQPFGGASFCVLLQKTLTIFHYKPLICLVWLWCLCGKVYYQIWWPQGCISCGILVSGIGAHAEIPVMQRVWSTHKRTPNTFHDRAEARGIYSSLKEVDLLATLPLEVTSLFVGDDKKSSRSKFRTTRFLPWPVSAHPLIWNQGGSTWHTVNNLASGNGRNVCKCLFTEHKNIGKSFEREQKRRWKHLQRVERMVASDHSRRHHCVHTQGDSFFWKELNALFAVCMIFIIHWV